MKLLLLEDDVALGFELSRGLRRAGFAVDLVTGLRDADVAVSVNVYDCLVFDRTVPDGDSIDLLAALRHRGVLTPALLLTARDTIEERVEGFEYGADDYLVKPFAQVELVARIRALGRRAPFGASTVLAVGDIVLDVPRHVVARAGVELSLVIKEFAVLQTLMRRPGEVVSRSELIESCWDELNDPASNVVDVVVAQLRRRLGPPDPIRTVRGVGYSIDTP